LNTDIEWCNMNLFARPVSKPAVPASATTGAHHPYVPDIDRHSWLGPRAHRSYHIRPYLMDWEHHFHPPGDWSVFQQTIRTNNDVEGWHYRTNHRGKRAKLPFYMLCHLLYREAQLISMQVLYLGRFWPVSSDLVLSTSPHTSWYSKEIILLVLVLPDISCQLAVVWSALELKSELLCM